MAGATFQSPPLIEIVAELRWGLPEIGLPAEGQALQGNFPMGIGPSNKLEELFMRFGARAAGHGYTSFERVVPAGFPLLPFQPVYRYRKPSEDRSTTLYQLGSGVFTANTTPPYQNWHAFFPVVDLGVDLLFEAMAQGKDNPTFSSISLRYIDAFNRTLTQGKSLRQFVSETLGIGFSIPESITKQCVDLDGIKPFFKLVVPVDIGHLNLSFGEGSVNDEPAVLMDTTVVSSAEVQSKQKIMELLNRAHEVIHATFLGLTTPIHALMVPVKT